MKNHPWIIFYVGISCLEGCKRWSVAETDAILETPQTLKFRVARPRVDGINPRCGSESELQIDAVSFILKNPLESNFHRYRDIKPTQGQMFAGDLDTNCSRDSHPCLPPVPRSGSITRSRFFGTTNEVITQLGLGHIDKHILYTLRLNSNLQTQAMCVFKPKDRELLGSSLREPTQSGAESDRTATLVMSLPRYGRVGQGNIKKQSKLHSREAAPPRLETLWPQCEGTRLT